MQLAAGNLLGPIKRMRCKPYQEDCSQQAVAIAAGFILLVLMALGLLLEVSGPLTAMTTCTTLTRLTVAVVTSLAACFCPLLCRGGPSGYSTDLSQLPRKTRTMPSRSNQASAEEHDKHVGQTRSAQALLKGLIIRMCRRGTPAAVKAAIGGRRRPFGAALQFNL